MSSPSTPQERARSQQTAPCDDVFEQFSYSKPQDQDWLEWKYTLRGGLIKHRNTIYEVIRIPNTFSDRVINQTADLPPVPWPGARIIGNQIERWTQDELEINVKQLGYDLDLNHIDNGVGSEYSKRSKLAIESESFRSLDLVDYCEEIHHAKIPHSVEEIENLKVVIGLPHLVQLVGRTPDGRIVTTKFGQTTLMDVAFDKKTNIPDKRKINWMLDIVDGLEALHQLNILHKDLMPWNVLIDGDQAIICDLESYHKIGGADAPESNIEQPYTTKSDIYSLGGIMWAMENRNKARPHLTLRPSGILKDIMARCLAADPDNRPSLDWITSELDTLLSASGMADFTDR
ncbi:uncharacterized protein I303_105534 [Kwoniella dejecticola CBS 10117]|uniref:Serine/threonine protein kinase n=1 Tax=Kwoniella dejecticola CBS 10117 TaxID=1296121 RepID=A0A1A6A278_9TREE|nr:serine/threonine protein kinase [Kwoniella dejecticola CBS 10117]OBR84167.1 serine/threonine protein kinase [Kwoniella dejecticola CBS 10117]